MAVDGSPPPPPSSPPPSFARDDDADQETGSNFKSLQQMLAKTRTMYTSSRPAPPPKPIRSVTPGRGNDESPKLEHRTKERPRRKTRAPSRTALRERASSSSIDSFGIDSTHTVGAPPPISTSITSPPLVESQEINAPSPPSPASSPSSPPPTPPPSPPPSPPASPPPSPPTSSLPSKPFAATSPSSSSLTLHRSEFQVDTDEPAVGVQDKVCGAKDTLNHNASSAKDTGASKSLWQSSAAHLKSKSAPAQHQPLISVVPLKRTDISSSTAVQSSTATFTNRLKQIRERREARKSPSPSALSPTHSSSSLPQYMEPLVESAVEDAAAESSVPISVSPVMSQASLDSSSQRGGSTHPHSDLWSPSLYERSTRARHRGKTKTDSSNPPSLPSSVTPSPPPSPPPSSPPSPPPSPPSSLLPLSSSLTPLPQSGAPPSPPPPSLPSSFPSLTSSINPCLAQSIPSCSPPSLTPPSTFSPSAPAIPPPPRESVVTTTSVVEGMTVTLAKMTDELETNFRTSKSSESLSSSSDSAPELPSLPPPLALETTDNAQSPVGNKQTHSIYLDSPPLLPDIAEATSVTSDSSAPPSSISTPRMATGPVQLRHPQKSVGNRPERRSAFEAMLISESSGGTKRLSVTERRALTLQASRRPDAASQPVMKRWSDTSDILSSLSPEESDRAKSALAMLGLGERGSVDLGGSGTQNATIPTDSNSSSAGNSGLLVPGEVSSPATETSVKGVRSAKGYNGHSVDGVTNILPSAESAKKRKETESTDYQQSLISQLSSPWEVTHDDPDDLEDYPSTWSVDQVCEWLELVGLGTYRDTFRDNSVDGATLLNMDVQLFAELGVDSPEIRELFLSKIYDLSNPTRNMDDMQDDFCLEVDSYTEQDWKKLEAAVDALKSPVLRDDIELDPSAIGQFLHTDYVHSRSTPNIHQLQQMPHSDTDLASTENLVPHSSTVHSFPDYAPTSQAVSTDQVRRKKLRAPSTRSIQREYIVSMAEAGDRPNRRQSASNHTTRPSSSISSRQGSPSLGSRHSAIELSTSPPHKKGALTSKTGEGKKKRRSKTTEGSSQSSAVPYGPMTAALTKDLDQGVIVHEEGKYLRVRLGSYLKQTARDGRTSSIQGTDTGLVRLYMQNVQEGLHYKGFLVTQRTSAAELVEKALERGHLLDNPHHYCIWQVASANTELSRELAPSECPLTLQLNWTQSSNYHFEMRLKENIQRVQFLLDLPLCSRADVRLSLPTSASTAEAVQSILGVLGLSETYSQRGVHCALMDVTSRTRAERALAEKECPVSLLKTGQKLKLVSLSVQKRHSSVQSDSSLLARVHQLEQEKALLTEQLQSAQSIMRSHIEAVGQQRRLSTGGTTGPADTLIKPQLKKMNQPQESHDGGAQERVVGEAEEQVVETLRGLNTALNNQLQQQGENMTVLTQEKQRLEKNVLELTSRDKEMVLEVGVLKATIAGLKEQLSDAEQSRKQLQQSLEVIDKSHPHDDMDMNSLQGSLKRAQQEITRLQRTNQEQAMKLQVAEEKRLKAVHSVRQYMVKSGVAEKEEEDMEGGVDSASMYRASPADLVKACKHANKELRQHRVYLDQLLAIVIDKHPQILAMVTEAQKMRDLVDSESWC